MGSNGICRLIERKRALVTRTGVKAYWIWLEGVNGRKGRFRESLYNCDNEIIDFQIVEIKKVLPMYNYVHLNVQKCTFFFIR